MDTVKLTHKGVTRMIAHRGASALERENTNAAFLAAANRSYWGIETDVHRTADRQFVLIHDGDTGRVSSINLPVEESTLADLRAIRLYDTHGLGTRGDLVIPTVEEYAAICRDYGKIAVLELKSNFTPDEIAAIIDILRAQDALDQVIFISFHLENLLILRNLLPDHPVQFLSGQMNEEIFDLLIAHHMDLDVHHAALTAQWIDRCHAAGIAVNAWTVDDPAIAERLISWGIDYITSNCCE